MPYIESFEEFAARMGCDYEWIDSRYLFANGGQSNGELGVHANPPDSKWDALHLRREFLQFKLDRELTKWHAFKADCLVQASLYKRNHGPGNSVMPPPPDAEEQLERGRKRINALREQVEDLDEQLADSPGAQAAKARQQRHADDVAQIEDYASRITNIDL